MIMIALPSVQRKCRGRPWPCCLLMQRCVINHHLHHYHHHPPHHNQHHHPCHARLFNFLPHCIVAMQKHSMWLKIFQEWETNSKILKIGFHGNLRSFKSGSGCRCFLVFVAIFTVLCNSASFSYFSTDILPT